ncbi:MAG: hypothetical protein M1830_009536 [Pleopsidium flavum]|nr:MAG: hypothetical protein M1830_009536 [Pleopsidium flavum]
MLVYGLNDAESRGWKSPAIIVTVILGALCLAAFPIIESMVTAPAVPTSILKNIHVIVPLTVFMFVGGGWYVSNSPILRKEITELTDGRVTWFFISTQISLNSLQYQTVLAAAYFLPATAAAILTGGIGNTLVGKGYAKIVIVLGYIVSIGALVPWGFVGPQHGPWFVIVFAMLYLAASPPIAVGAQAIVLHEIPVEMHGTASAMMNVMYQFGSALFLAVVNLVIKSKTPDQTARGLLRGYHFGMWTLLGFTAAGFVAFVVLYLPVKSTRGGMLEKEGVTASPLSGVATDENKDEEESRVEAPAGSV